MVPNSITSDRDAKFLLTFYKEFWNKLHTVLQFSTMLGNLLHLLGGKKSGEWDICLPHADFAYNSMPSRTMKVSPFIVVYE